MEHAEVKRIAVLAWSVLWYLLRGAFPEARSHLRCVFIRCGESIVLPRRPATVSCGFCGWSGARFRTFAAGRWTRANALCPRCGSLERHRSFLQVFLEVRRSLPARIRLLDIAPTETFGAWCARESSIDYLSIDLVSPVAMRHMDIQDLRLPDASFDVVVCFHVLDYVPDDRRAMREIRRVLRPDGLAILQEHFDADRPTEEWGAPDPVLLGRVRAYGNDFPERLQEAGFAIRYRERILLARPRGKGTP